MRCSSPRDKPTFGWKHTPKHGILAAIKLILEEAGARFCNFDGGSSIYGGNGMAYVTSLEPVVQDLLR